MKYDIKILDESKISRTVCVSHAYLALFCYSSRPRGYCLNSFTRINNYRKVKMMTKKIKCKKFDFKIEDIN